MKNQIFRFLYRKTIRKLVLKILSIHGPVELWALACQLRPQILHIGAHKAEEDEVYRQLGFRETCWVEAQPSLFPFLRKKVGEQYSICSAVWSDHRELNLRIANNSVSSSFFKLSIENPWKHIQEVETVRVKTSTLDDVVREFSRRGVLNHDIFLVLDIQGAELHALEGLREFRDRVIAISCEVSEDAIYELGVQRKQIHSLLNSWGFLPQAGFLDSKTKHGDQLFVRKRYVATLPKIALFSLARLVLLKVIDHLK